MSSITVEKIRLTGALQIPVLTQAQIDALSPEQGQIVYNSDINYIQIYGPFDNWGLTDIGTGNDLWDMENQSNNGTNSQLFKSLVARGDNEGPDAFQMAASYSNDSGAWAGNTRFLYQSGFQGYQTVAIPKDGLYRFEIVCVLFSSPTGFPCSPPSVWTFCILELYLRLHKTITNFALF